MITDRDNPSNMHSRVERLLIPFDLICDIDLGCIRYLKTDAFMHSSIQKDKDEDLYYTEDNINPIKFMIPEFDIKDAVAMFSKMCDTRNDLIAMMTFGGPMQLSKLLQRYMSMDDVKVQVDILVDNAIEEEYIEKNYNSPKIKSIYFGEMVVSDYDNIFIKYHEELTTFYDVADLRGKNITFIGSAHNLTIDELIYTIFENNLITSRMMAYEKMEAPINE